MICNIGKTDRIIRFTLGFIILAGGLITQNWFGLIGIIPIATAALKWCPAYVPFGIKTDT
jgi:hypothetical protein